MRPLTRCMSLARALAVGAALVAAVAATAFVTAANRASAQEPELVEHGRELFLTHCSGCHGLSGEGVGRTEGGGAWGPALDESGEAGAYFMLATGRMPAADPDQQQVARERAFDVDQIDALVAYVASLGDGPPLPDVDIADADLASGGEVYRLNCQPCHSASGSGGALSYGQAAPRLASSTLEVIGAAVRFGPSPMPAFSAESITDEQLDDLARYVRYLDEPDDAGGIPLGRTGPIAEGFVAWAVGVPLLLLGVVWIGTRLPIRRGRSQES